MRPLEISRIYLLFLKPYFVNLSVCSDAKIASQISVLNRDYRSAGVVWRLASTDRTMNASWFNISPDSPAQTAMKKALRKGNGPADLNVFTVGFVTFDYYS